MNRAEKAEVIEGLNKTFSESGGVIVLTFQGINVPDITALRQKIRDLDAEYLVVKNTLAIRASEGTSAGSLKPYFKGQTAIACSRRDSVSVAKALKEFVKTHPGMVFRAGVLDGRLINDKQVEDLAEMPSKEELLGKLLYLLNAPLTRLATALNSPLQKLAVGLKEVAKVRQ